MAEVKKQIKNFFQYTQEQFKKEKPEPGNLYFIREVELNEDGSEKEDENGEKNPTGNAEIWFGTRKYAETSINNLTEESLKNYYKKSEVYNKTEIDTNIPIVRGSAEHSAILNGEYEGYSNNAISQVSIAIGAATTAGLKGWYYSKIEFGTKPVITLSDKQPTVLFNNLVGGKWSSGTPNITAGDKISIVNNAKYDYCGEVESVSGNKITLKASLPFDSLDVGVISVNNPDDWTIYLPDRADAGIIDFGGGALAEGVNTKATNIGAHAEGIQTHAYGQYSHTEGRETKAGYGAHAEGRETVASGNLSHAEGRESVASGTHSHAEGRKTIASNTQSHAEGIQTQATGINSHAEGNTTIASGDNSHAEGNSTTASGSRSHAEGNTTIASGNQSHAEGRETTSEGSCAHAEGYETGATGIASHAEGYKSQAQGNGSHAEGGYHINSSDSAVGGVASGNASHAEGINTKASGVASHTEGYKTTTSTTAMGSHAEGCETLAEGEYSHAEGYKTQATGSTSHTEGSETIASGDYSHAEGNKTNASGKGAHAEGGATFSKGAYSHAEGYGVTAYGKHTHAEGHSTNTLSTIGDELSKDEYISKWGETKFGMAYGEDSHFEGKDNLAVGVQSHAEGLNNKAIGDQSHAEGIETIADGLGSHAEGKNTKSSNNYSHAEGYATKALGAQSHSEGNATTAKGSDAHTEGKKSCAFGSQSHAEGLGTNSPSNDAINAEDGGVTIKLEWESNKNINIAVGAASHVEGRNNLAYGVRSHAGGNQTETIGENSFAHGNNVKATNANEIAFGKFNLSSTDTLFSVGNGASDTDRKNVFEITTSKGYVHNKEIATKATTLLGYGITNAYTKTEVDNKLSSKADQIDINNLQEKITSLENEVINKRYIYCGTF